MIGICFVSDRNLSKGTGRPQRGGIFIPEKRYGRHGWTLWECPGSPGNQGESGEDGKQDPLHGHDESAQTQKPQRTTDSWEEGKHPRKENGQFGRGNTAGSKALNKPDQSDNVSLEKVQGIEKELRKLGVLHAGETVECPDHIKITDVSDHARERMKERNITMEMAQGYVDNAW